MPEFLNRVKQLRTDSHLRVLLPNWEKIKISRPRIATVTSYIRINLGEFNISISSFCLTGFDDWLKEVVSNANGAYHGRVEAASRKGKRSISGASDGYVRELRQFITEYFVKLR